MLIFYVYLARGYHGREKPILIPCLGTCFFVAVVIIIIHNDLSQPCM